MSRALPFTEASLRRAIIAARRAGLYVTGITADGTVLVSESRPAEAPARQGDEPQIDWSDTDAWGKFEA